MDAIITSQLAGGMDASQLAGLAPSHPLFQQVQQQYLALNMANPVLLQQTTGQGEINEDLARMAQEDVQETVSDEVFSAHVHHEILPGCRPHPGDIVEAGSLAALPLPQSKYPLADSLPEEAISEGKLSSLQLEGILYACQRHQMILPNGNRAGFFIGDGAGVGKGRQIAGVILDNFARGRTKHIWFTISTDLVVDSRRDLHDIGCHIKVIEGCQQLDKETKVLGLPADFKEGVVFSTYATLVSSVRSGGMLSSSRTSRLQQLADWCGGAQFEGCLIFDECHKAKNFVPGKETASTKVAMAVCQIQRMLPKARVLYCSATGVTDVKNMAFMERLGLWGEGAPFKSFDQFIETVHKKGLGVAEMLAMEMKTSGLYVSRGLSFKQAEFMSMEVELTKQQIQMYDVAAHVWNEIRKSLTIALERTGNSNNRVWSSFWGAHQRFFKQMCLGMKVPAIVAEAKKSLEEGHCVVIGLQTTGEASMESEANKGVPLTNFVSLCREILSRFVQTHFPTVVETQSAVAAQGTVDDWSATAKQMLLGFTQQIKLPDSTLDEIIDQLGGAENVAEMTGRRARMVRSSPSDTPRYDVRGSEAADGLDSLNVRERNMFMEGKKLVAIISDAASTGISLHADVRAGNQRRRVHMTIELPWSADKAVQQLGRSHRSNQASGPLYKLMTTNLGGERRFASAVAKRLQSLGALTKGDRRAASGADLTEFNFDTPYGRAALRALYAGICQNEVPPGVIFSEVNQGQFEDVQALNTELQACLELMDVSEFDPIRGGAKVKDKEAGDVGKFLNRILGLSVKRQHLIFNYFCKCLDGQIQNAKKEGRFNEGLVDITASSVQTLVAPREVFKQANKGNNPTKHVILSVDRGMSWEHALQRLENNPGTDNSFYKSNRQMWGKTLYILATLKQGSNHLFKVARPNTGLSAFEEDRDDLGQKYTRISQQDAEAGWREQYENSKDHCIHGPKCRAGGTCTVGSRCYRMHLLCGGIITLMSVLETTIARYGPRLQLSKAESHLRSVRVKLDSGERIVGIRFPEMLIPLVEKTLEEQKIIENVRLQQAGVVSGAAVGEAVEGSSSKVNTLSEQDVAVVVPRCLKKALTPPVTIKNFFKATEKKVEREMGSTCVDIARDNKPCKEVQDAQENDGEVVIVNKTKDSSKQPQKGLKRTLQDAFKRTPTAKKAKQGNIMASFAKQKSDQEKDKKGAVCPICGKQFEIGMKNAEINNHIDNCLIE